MLYPSLYETGSGEQLPHVQHHFHFIKISVTTTIIKKFFVPGSKTHQHLKLAILPNVPGGVVDSSDKATEIPGPCLPVLFWDHLILLKGLIVSLCFFLKEWWEIMKVHQCI